MTHDEIQADLSLFALDVLEPDEHRTIETHLSTGCLDCTAELARWREVVGMLALESERAPAPALKPALLQRVHGPRTTASGGAGRPPRRWLELAVPLAIVAAVLLVLIVRDARQRERLALQRQQMASLDQQVESERVQLERIRTELATKEQDVTTLRAALAAAQQALAVLQSPRLQLVRLQKTPDAPPAEAHVLISHDAGRALFYAFDLPPVAADQTYQLWWITERDGPVNAGLFRPDARGLGQLETAVPSGAGAIQASAVTIEPAAGVPKPTGPMVLLGKTA